jgi:Phage integrase family
LPPTKGTPLDPSKPSKEYLRLALTRAGITKPFRPFHDLRHTALTHEAAAGNPAVYVELKAGHSQASITERYIHAAQVLSPGAEPPNAARIACSANCPSHKRAPVRPMTLSLQTKKALIPEPFSVAGAGFEPATSGL